MRRRPSGPCALLALLPLLLGAAEPLRVVSLNPSLTATVVALGAERTLVGVDEWSAKQQPAARDLPLGGPRGVSSRDLGSLQLPGLGGMRWLATAS